MAVLTTESAITILCNVCLIQVFIQLKCDSNDNNKKTPEKKDKKHKL